MSRGLILHTCDNYMWRQASLGPQGYGHYRRHDRCYPLLTVFLTLTYALTLPFQLGLVVAVDLLILYVLQNQAKNYRKWSNHPTVFPNPTGGGILGEYMLRPWRNELESMYPGKPEKQNGKLKKTHRSSRKRKRRARQLQKERSL